MGSYNEKLVEAGVKELLVISQDTSAYGLDLKYAESPWKGAPLKARFLELCRALGDLGAWVRLHYVYPYPHVDDVIPLMAEGRVLPYLDIPFQHASPTVLKAMRRPAHQEKTLDRIRRWRTISPDLVLRSTFIVGFPGETEEDFNETLSLVAEVEYDGLYIFNYSPRPRTPAAAYTDSVPDEVKAARFTKLQELQYRIQSERYRRYLRRIVEVLVENVSSRTTSDYSGHTRCNKVVNFPGTEELLGQLVKVRITGVKRNSMYGELVEALPKVSTAKP